MSHPLAHPTDTALRPRRQRLLRLVICWRDRRRGRQALARLEAERLADIAVRPDQARREAAKPFWRP